MNRYRHVALRILIAALVWLLAAPVMAKRLNLEFEIDGMQRRVLVMTPKKIGTDPLPLIIVFHGRGDDSEKFASAVKLHRDWPEAIVVYPRGEYIDTQPPMRGWQYRRGTYRDRDLKLTDRVLAELNGRYAIDPQQTYAAGFSNGGHFVFLLMAERNQAFAAFVAIGALQPNYRSTAPPRPMLYLFGRGENPEYHGDWTATVKTLIAHNRVVDTPRDYLGCCRWHAAGPDGAVFVYGAYNAGHIWPHEGNEWIQSFLHDLRPAPLSTE
jgi:polyhydroxybutyrate depolymerase